MPRIEETTELSTLAATDATASTIAGGQAYMADVARRLAPYVARSQSGSVANLLFREFGCL